MSTRQLTRQLTEYAQQLRVDSVRVAAAAGSGHPTSAMSAAELMAVLLARHFRYDFERPQHPAATTASSSPKGTPPRCCTPRTRRSVPSARPSC